MEIASRTAALLLLFFAGCSPLQTGTQVSVADTFDSPKNYFVSPYLHQYKPRRAVIVYSQNGNQVFPEQTIFANALANEMKRSGVIDAVVADPSNCGEPIVSNGRLSYHKLVELTRLYHADSVIIANISSISTFEPMHMTASVSLIDAREAVVLWAFDGNWDLRKDSTKKSFRKFVCDTTSQDGFSSDIYYQSPTAFVEFVARGVSWFVKSL